MARCGFISTHAMRLAPVYTQGHATVGHLVNVGEGRSLPWATAVHFRMKTIDKRTSSFRSGGAAEGAGNAARLPCPVVLSKSGLTLSRLYKPHTKPDMATATRAAVAHSNLLFSLLRQF